MLRKNKGFTLIELVVAVGLFAVLTTSLMSLMVLSGKTMHNMENTIGRKSQYQRGVSFITNTIRRNQQEDAVTIYDSNQRVVVALADQPGKYLHYFIYNGLEDKELLMYIGSEKEMLPVITESNKYEKTMVLAKHMQEIIFDFETGSDATKKILKVTYFASDTDGIEEKHVDRINLYVN